MADSALRDMTTHRRVKLGTLVAEFATPGIGHILKSAGCDFVFFDMEHSGFSMETFKSVVRYFEAADLPMMVRVPSQDYHFLARAMDMGAEGLIAPMVSTVEQAQHIINSMKYHPVGARGVALQIAHDRYRPGSVADKFGEANSRSAFICLIETADGVKNIDGIAALEGVDCLWVGHFDLSVSLGIPGDFTNPIFIGAIDDVIRAAKKHNKSLGRLVPNVQQGTDYYGQGFDFICYSGDVWVFHDAMSDALSKLRAGCK
ncbi:aldolase/citrate lyase family protein [Mesorhizobium sp. M7A.F.Ca.US.008.03.1.1]|uniref:HpcH/HpaI aldolase family protein n=1 Tax=Mesorhizobium sp. M7A.F.Ca.US.008.03.1.1 TaxID=2496742 RepID=UPI000FCB6B33|nr:aldolase/citrate lyase family protein [Mesorhizobium sp. M7A.F.Ca.US.008.03.1.1]RUW60723.1 hpch/hpai aldolase [Mesorhizobium sp. M7A.F.Ca.US.008.03.1.1]